MYSMVFHCRMTGGRAQGYPLETSAVGFFARDGLPQPLAGAHRWLDIAFRAIDGEELPALVRRAPLGALARVSGRPSARPVSVCGVLRLELSEQ